MAKIYDLKNNEYIYENQYGGKALDFLYNNAIGRILLKLIFINPIYSEINRIFNNGRNSLKKVNRVIKAFNVNLNEFEGGYKSFNEFFIRKLKDGSRNIDLKSNSLIAPCDSKALVYKITDNSKINIKGSDYSLDELLKDKYITDKFKNGYVLVFRLSVGDYHRYCHIDNGKEIYRKRIKGVLHTVSSISEKYKIYKENKREYSVISGDNLGLYVQMEVGAIQVGKIVNYSKKPKKGEEKGYFAYGGSTVILILSDKVKIDNKIAEHSNKKIETKVLYGEKIGEIEK